MSTGQAQKFMRSSWASAVVVLAALAGSTSCSGQDQGKNLEMVFNPTKSYLLPGSGSSCNDFHQALSSLDGTVGTSVAELRLVYPTFSLSWASTDLLYVAFMTVTLRGSNLTGGVAEVKLTNTDIEPILGIGPGAAFNGALYPTPTGRQKTITTAVERTYATSSGGTLRFPACAFMVGGITLINPRRAFAGTATVTLVGFSVARDGSQTPVRKIANLQFEYVP